MRERDPNCVFKLPFGEELGSGTGSRSGGQGYGASDTNRWKYGMLQRDAATGLDHTWWRKYESLSGRWTSPDPLNGGIGDPQSFNHFSYAGNDPVNFVDPTGLNQDPPGQGPDPPGGWPTDPSVYGHLSTDTWAPYWPGGNGNAGSSHGLLLEIGDAATTFGGVIVRGTKAIVRNETKFLKCFESERFSADVSSLTKGTRLHGAATFLAQSAEIIPTLSVAGDAAAMTAKAARPGMLGTKETYASGAVRGTLTAVGDIATPVLAGTFAFTTSYNVAKAAGCRFDNPVP